MREKQRQALEIQSQVDQFLASGGRITTLPAGKSSDRSPAERPPFVGAKNPDKGDRYDDAGPDD